VTSFYFIKHVAVCVITKVAHNNLHQVGLFTFSSRILMRSYAERDRRIGIAVPSVRPFSCLFIWNTQV